MTRKERPERPLKATVKLETVKNTALAADLFATMLRSVEIEEQRERENANGCASDHGRKITR